MTDRVGIGVGVGVGVGEKRIRTAWFGALLADFMSPRS